MRQKQLVIDDTGSVEGILAQSGDQDRYHGCLTDGLTLKDRATQLLGEAVIYVLAEFLH